MNPPPTGAVLFAGSSSIRLWKTLAEDLPGITLINRGFGGSHLSDNVFFAEQIVFPYKPKLIVLHVGTNDIHSGKSPEQVFSDFKTYVAKVRSRLPDTRIVFMEINASPARWAEAEKQKEANRLIKEYCASGKNLGFIELFDAMLGPDGLPREDLYKDDKLHPNEAGYKIRTERVKPHLQ